MRCLVWVLGSLALLGSLPTSARAYEDHVTLGVGAGYIGMPESEGRPLHGVDIAVSAGGGFGDAWSLQGVISYNVFPGSPTLHMSVAGLETVYALDIVRFVPLLGAGLDGIWTVRERQARGDFALHVLLGADYLVTSRWIIGVDARGFWVSTHSQSALGPFLVTVALRGTVRFGLR